MRFERRGFGGRRFGSRDFGARIPKPIKVGEEYDVEISEVGSRGDGIARIKNFVVFVSGAKQGEKTRVKITEVRNRFAVAEKVGEVTGETEAETKETSESEEEEKMPEEETEKTEEEVEKTEEPESEERTEETPEEESEEGKESE